MSSTPREELAADHTDGTDLEVGGMNKETGAKRTTGDTESTEKAGNDESGRRKEEMGRELATGCAHGADREGEELTTEGTESTEKREEEDKENGGLDDVNERIAELRAEGQRLRRQIAQGRIQQELVWAATTQDAVSAAQVAALMKDRVRVDDELRPIVVDENGDPAMDAHGRPVTVAEAVRAFLDENPHLVGPAAGVLLTEGTGRTEPTEAGAPRTGPRRRGRLDSGLTALTGRTPTAYGGSADGAWPSPGRELIAEALREGE